MIEKRQCMRCGIDLPYGSLVYVVQIKVFADFDGVILDPDEESHQSMEKLLEQIQKADPKELEREVYEEFMFVLCKRCRDGFVDETQHSGDLFSYQPKGLDRILH